MVRSTKNIFAVCPDCAAQYPLTDTDTHRCGSQGQRMAAELIDLHIDDFLDIRHRRDYNGCGILWLIRIAYRIRQRMNGMEKYGDRATLARVACELGGEWVK